MYDKIHYKKKKKTKRKLKSKIKFGKKIKNNLFIVLFYLRTDFWLEKRELENFLNPQLHHVHLP